MPNALLSQTLQGDLFLIESALKTWADFQQLPDAPTYEFITNVFEALHRVEARLKGQVDHD